MNDIRRWMVLVEAKDDILVAGGDYNGPGVSDFLGDLARASQERDPNYRPPPLPKRKSVRPQARPVRSGRFPDFLERVRREAATYLGVEGDEIERDDVRRWLTMHRDLFHRKRVRLYRVMRVPDTFIETLAAGSELGQHWSFNYNPHNIEAFYTRRDYGKDVSLFLFEVEADAADMALELTVAYNCLFPDEEEVFLGGWGSAPLFQSVQRIDHDGEPDGSNLRPDLIGVVMKP